MFYKLVIETTYNLIYLIIRKSFLSHIRNTIDNFNPHIILFGHVDILNEKDFYNLRCDYKKLIFTILC